MTTNAQNDAVSYLSAYNSISILLSEMDLSSPDLKETQDKITGVFFKEHRKLVDVLFSQKESLDLSFDIDACGEIALRSIEEKIKTSDLPNSVKEFVKTILWKKNTPPSCTLASR